MKRDKITPLIKSEPAMMIGSRFRVKGSEMDNGVHPISYMLAIQDLQTTGFSLKFFKNLEDAAVLINLLKQAANVV
jgi:hypothetical protein